MTNKFREICVKHGLTVVDPNTFQDLPFCAVMKQIYFEWYKDDLQNFMDDLMRWESEEGYGEELFDD